MRAHQMDRLELAPIRIICYGCVKSNIDSKMTSNNCCQITVTERLLNSQLLRNMEKRRPIHYHNHQNVKLIFVGLKTKSLVNWTKKFATILRKFGKNNPPILELNIEDMYIHINIHSLPSTFFINKKSKEVFYSRTAPRNKNYRMQKKRMPKCGYLKLITEEVNK